MYRTVVISSFGRLSALAAMVWTGSDLALWLPIVLVLPAQFQAFRGNGELSITLFRGSPIREHFCSEKYIVSYCIQKKWASVLLRNRSWRSDVVKQVEQTDQL